MAALIKGNVEGGWVCVWVFCVLLINFLKTEVIFWFCSQGEVAEEVFYFIFYIYYNFLLYIFALLKA